MVSNKDYRLFQLISPSLPVGAFSYSQGLERAIELGWVTNKSTFCQWLTSMLESSLMTLELPLLRRMHTALSDNDINQVNRLNDWFYANRETFELRSEEKTRGKAMARLITQLGIVNSSDKTLVDLSAHNSLIGFALACVVWELDEDSMCRGFLWSWLENSTMAGIKLIPLGQTDGQRVMLEMDTAMNNAVEQSNHIVDSDIGSFTPAQVIASSRHETQYTRLFRS
ncbi:urease accessory protein UreF [Veronia pacifica]|uniref:Urease accessory protein UreF n=1 Tax=Veronia pacifica TaxID=1080227 RepID=A0A1C3EEX1_9GAMM|nr:urease accessory protein UreF [Veronia pacifica]ODA31802.1 urease accessory protein UreF [Veronia pacifica]